MSSSRHRLLVSCCASLALVLGLAVCPALARELRISHQFAEGDARHALAEDFAKAVAEKTQGELTFKIFPSQALFKSAAQYDALSKGALDLSVFPLAYASGKVPELDVTLMPCIITSVEEGMAWRNKPIGKKVEDICEARGMKILTWLWYAGGIGSRGKPVILPEDSKQLKFRAAGKMFEFMLNQAGASITSMPSSEIYMALQTKVLDACLTSAESFVSYRLYEQLEYLNTPDQYSVWYMAEPIVIGMKTWESLTPTQQAAVTEVGLSLEKKAAQISVEANAVVSKVFQENGVKTHAMTLAEWQVWEKLAKETAWKEFAAKVPGGQGLLDLAKQ